MERFGFVASLMNGSRAIADLVWAINSPGLIESAETEAHSLPKIDPSYVDRQRLLRFLESNPCNRVGRYFEHLIRFYFQDVLGYEIVAYQRPIVVDRRTVGEIDFLYRDSAGLLTHLEVAVKFYLYLAGGMHNGSHFVGPNASDTFERKTQKLFKHQLPLSRAHHLDVDQCAAMMKGRIYLHAESTAPAVVPRWMADSHLRGTWLQASEFDKLRCHASASWQVLEKPFWLTADPNAKSLTIDQFKSVVQNHFANSAYPIHCAALESGHELERVFIVSDEWPNATSGRP